MADREYCSACNKLKEQNSEFVLHGVTDAICQSLANNTGITASLGHDDCEDLKDIVECLMGQMIDAVDSYDVCDWDEYMKKFSTNTKTTLDALVCSECGQWTNIDDLWNEIGKIWTEISDIRNEINSIKNTIQGFASQNYVVEPRFNVAQQTPGFSITIARDGTFVFNWSDWYGENLRIGRGSLTGKVNFCMTPLSGQSATWKINSFTLNTVSYITDAAYESAFTITVRVPSSTGAIAYQRSHNGMSNFTDNINQTIAVGKTGTISPSSNSGWQTFMHFYNDGALADDEGDVQLRFINNNLTPVPSC